MSEAAADAGLARALEISYELLRTAENGNVDDVAVLDAERRRLLQSRRQMGVDLSDDERLMLGTIGQLNDRALGFLEHRRRRTERQMDTASVGRRALAAYSETQLRR